MGGCRANGSKDDLRRVWGWEAVGRVVRLDYGPKDDLQWVWGWEAGGKVQDSELQGQPQVRVGLGGGWEGLGLRAPRTTLCAC